jgi:hypothetical protein
MGGLFVWAFAINLAVQHPVCVAVAPVLISNYQYQRRNHLKSCIVMQNVENNLVGLRGIKNFLLNY